MKNNFLKFIACLLAAMILVSVASVAVFADNEEAEGTTTTAPETEAETTEDTTTEDQTSEEPETEASEETKEGESETAEGETATTGEDKTTKDEEEEETEIITDEEAIARSEKAAENDNFILYLDEEYERIGFYVKETGVVYWSNCVNALSDTATTKANTRKNRLSNIGYKYGDATANTVAQAFYYSYKESTSKKKTEYELVDGGVRITYTLNTAKVVVPVNFILEDDYLNVYIDTAKIKENAGYKEGVSPEDSTSKVYILTEIALCPYFGAGSTEEEGYIFVPDGSGAVINFNNGKGNYKNYSTYIYGDDLTKSPNLQPDVTEQTYLPVMALVKENNGLVMIATDGDTYAKANAAVAGNKADQAGYNYCYFSFNLRSTDTYEMAGDGGSITMFERGNGKIAVDKIAVRYYPVTTNEETVPYTDIAKVYRDYLIEEKGLAKKVEANDSPLFVDYYGGTLKSKSILGIPVNLKTAFTTFSQATEITEKLADLGVDSMVVNFNDFTNDSMDSKIDVAKNPASVLGGKSGFKSMMSTLAEMGVEFYASVTGTTFKSNGNGFTTLFNTAYRVSKSYARLSEYDLAYGTPKGGIAAALLAPRSIASVAEKVIKNVEKLDLTGIGLGDWAQSLWSDFSNANYTVREETADHLIDYYKQVSKTTNVIADAPNAYLLPYVSRVNNLTLQSSQFKIVDEDIPFVQMVLHGYVGYATEPINASSDSRELFLKAIASGSNIHYDFIYAEATELVNTDYVNLYYANYEAWLEDAAAQYKLANEILAPVSDSVIVGYEVDGDVITTTYENGVVTVVNMETGVIKANGKTYNYDEIEGGKK